MKKIALLLCLTIACLSCSSDDNDDTSNDDNLFELGIYRLTSFVTETSFDLDGDGDSSNDLLIETGCLQNERLVFTADGLVASLSSSFLDIFIEIDTDSGETIQAVECIEEAESTVLTFETEGNTITIFDGTQVLIAGVISGNQLIFEIPEGFGFESVDGDTTVTIIEDTILTYDFQP